MREIHLIIVVYFRFIYFTHSNFIRLAHHHTVCTSYDVGIAICSNKRNLGCTEYVLKE
jgi:hypothetical protein